MSDIEHYMTRCGELSRELTTARADLAYINKIIKDALVWTKEFHPGGIFHEEAALQLGDSITIAGGEWLVAQLKSAREQIAGLERERDVYKEQRDAKEKMLAETESELTTARTALAEKEAECDAHKELLLVNSNRICDLEAENTRLRAECESLRDERDLLLARWPTEEKPTSFTTAG